MKLCLMVCTKMRYTEKPSCAGRGSEGLLARLEEQIQRRNLPVAVEASPCFGECEQGPNMRIAPGGIFFHRVDEGQFDTIFAALEDRLAHPIEGDEIADES